jgi:hypothetical protein
VRWVLLGFVLLGCGPESSVITAGDTTQGSSNGAGPTTTGSSTTSTTSTTADADTSTTEPDNEFETGSFIPVDPKGGGSIECDVWAQDCWPSDKCQAWANDGGMHWNATRCSLVDKAPASLGASCFATSDGYSGTDTCDWDTMCWNVDATTDLGTCVARCGGSEASPSCAEGLTCFGSNEGVINLCVPSCDPLEPACADGFACVQSSFDEFGCIPAGLVPSEAGSPCEDWNGCGTGLVCTTSASLPSCEASSCCASLCDVTAADSCIDGVDDVICDRLFDQGSAPAGLDDVGVCRLPP